MALLINQVKEKIGKTY